ncbi:DUF2214 domain-containing protein [Chelativorans sp. M5D2P16]|uniref:DUF2214 domain-containing protein n=1 Tax=Chelativorans sp. M5D2P16 TaxID=3095678 RepID=UPI002ACA6411|nr:DUF2214 domain-containing protein [Chelativorans sp. M5D2P16]MDZ5699292.1 DUF2214 domain-containing protein [Chelativorans sp. M5D2P16]
MLMEWLQALQEWQVATFFRRSFYAYPLLNATHIFSLALLIGAILPADLRMLGLFSGIPAAPFLKLMTRLAAAGLVLAILTGFLLFSVQPLEYAGNPAFLTKVSLVALGAANAAVIRLSPGWRAAAASGVVSPSLRFGAVLSLMLWLAALIAGRWIAFL